MRTSIAVREHIARARVALGFVPRPAESLRARGVRQRIQLADAVSPENPAVAALLYAEALRCGSGQGEADERAGASGRTLVDPLYFDALPASELATTLVSLRGQAHALRAVLAGPALLSNVRARWTLAAVVAALVMTAGAALWRPFAARDIALGKRVTASTVFPGYDLGALVDGVRGTYDGVGAHTRPGASDPWMMVDLGQMQSIHRIVVDNRGDRNMDDGLPFVIELSDDGDAFREVARRTTHFGDGSFGSPAWVLKLDARARYVRIRAHDYIALSELEVY